METRSVYGHVGSVCIIDPVTSPEPFTFERFTRVIESRLGLVPLFRRRLVDVPLGLDQPYWVADEDFDVEFHVRELALPSPGDDRQLAEQVARLHARPLDRSRPLWEMYLISGLKDGRLAIYNKVHHAAIDGVSGNDILAAVLDLSPEGREFRVAPPAGEEPPGPLYLLARSAVSLAGQPVRAIKLAAGLLKLAPGLVSTLLPFGGGDDSDAVLAPTLLRAPSTPFNASITPHRRWSFCDLPLSEVKRIKNAAGLTVNDVVMALCAGALRRWLADHHALPDVPLVAAVPVSVRTEDQEGTHGNRVSMMFGALATHLADPVERLRATHEAMRAAKEQHNAIPASLLADVSQFAAPVLANQAWRLSARLRLLERVSPFNLIISNVPGPNIPLYCAGAELQAYYPVSAITDGQGMNITVMSYRDRLYFGLIGCRELVPDIDVLAGYLADELHTLTGAVERLVAARPADGAALAQPAAAPEPASAEARPTAEGTKVAGDKAADLVALSPEATAAEARRRRRARRPRRPRAGRPPRARRPQRPRASRPPRARRPRRPRASRRRRRLLAGGGPPLVRQKQMALGDRVAGAGEPGGHRCIADVGRCGDALRALLDEHVSGLDQQVVAVPVATLLGHDADHADHRSEVVPAGHGEPDDLAVRRVRHPPPVARAR